MLNSNLRLLNIHFFTTLFYFFSVPIVYSQQRIYTGVIKIGPYQGNAEFQYIKDGKDTVLSGLFTMNGSTLDTSFSKNINYFSLRGKYKNNKPNGNWEFNNGDFVSSGKTMFLGYELLTKVNGLNHNLSFSVDNGMLNGELINHTYYVNQSELGETNFKNKLNYKNGKLIGNIELSNSRYRAEIYVNDDGKADRIWNIYDKISVKDIPTEQWLFKNGLLTTYSFQKNDSLEIIQNIFESKLLKEIDFSSIFFKILDYQINTDSSLFKSSYLAQLIIINDTVSHRNYNLIKNLGTSDYSKSITILVPHYPLSNQEVKQIDQFSKEVLLADSLYKTFTNNSFLDVMKQSDYELVTMIDSIKYIHESIIKPSFEILSLYENEFLEFIPRINLYKQFIQLNKPKGNKARIDTAISSEETYLVKIDTMKYKTTAHLLSYTDFATNRISIYNKILQQKLSTYLNQQELNVIEKDLLANSRLFFTKIDSLRMTVPEIYIGSLQSIKNSASKTFDSYWKITNTADRMNNVQELINYLSEIDKLLNHITSIPEFKNSLAKLYTVDIWNNFTFTTMKEITKKPIFKSFNDLIIPYLVKETEKKLNLKDVKNMNELFNNTYERLIQLRDEDTQDIEKRIKKIKNVHETLVLLKIISN